MSSLTDLPTVNLTLPACVSSQPIVNKLREQVSAELPLAVVAGILPGSLGNNEAVAYSDVDALLLLRDEYCQNNLPTGNICSKLRRLQSVLYQHDPLQHHGFFVLSENALNLWPEHYLPSAAIAHASVFSQSEEFTMVIRPVFDHEKALSSALTLVRSIKRELDNKRYLSGLYQLKSTLSKLMLLPAMYVHVRDGRGVFKKESFALAKPDFDPSAWLAIEIASRIRSHWPSVKLRRPHALFAARGRLGNIARKLGYPIPTAIRLHLTPDFDIAAKQLTADARLLLETQRQVPAG